jgi:phosphomannomutase
VVRVDDLAQGDPGRGFGPNDVITLHLEGARVVVRPSGTEPKLKCYVEVVEPVADRTDLPDARVRALAAIDDVIADLARLIRL